MITLEKLLIFEKYGESEDAFSRCATFEEKIILSHEDFMEINTLLQNLSMTRKGLVSDEFSKDIKIALHRSCDHESTVKKLEELAASQ